MTRISEAISLRNRAFMLGKSLSHWKSLFRSNRKLYVTYAFIVIQLKNKFLQPVLTKWRRHLAYQKAKRFARNLFTYKTKEKAFLTLKSSSLKSQRLKAISTYLRESQITKMIVNAFGEMKYTHFHEAFFKNPDKSGIEFPSIAQLRSDWNKVNETLTAGIATLQPEEWLHKHTAVSEEDFAKEPNRNKLNVLMTRTIHLASHYGQLLFLKKNA